MKPNPLQAEVDACTAAVKAAAIAAAKKIHDNPGVWYPCGFSSVRIKPARGKLVTALKELDLGSVDSYDGGFVVYNPSRNPTQWMDAKVAGSRAFAESLEAFVKATGGKTRFIVESRMD